MVFLFTNVLVDLAVRVAKQRLQQENTIADHTSLEVEEVVELSKVLLRNSYILCFSRISISVDLQKSNGLPNVRNSSKCGDGGHT